MLPDRQQLHRQRVTNATRKDAIVHQFVTAFPPREEMEPKTLYVSIPFRMANHLCICGCGTESPTPLAPTEWSMTFDGESVSLHPSIGNQNMDCQSHYWIKGGQAIWIPNRLMLGELDKKPKGIMSLIRRIMTKSAWKRLFQG